MRGCGEGRISEGGRAGVAEEERVLAVVVKHERRLRLVEERRVQDAAAIGRELTREEAQPAALAL